MDTIKHIKLGKHKGLKEGHLLDLGKINVICGPNSSGKTTVLECIESKKLALLGRNPDQDFIDKIYARSLSSCGWSNGQNYLNTYYQALIEEICSSEKVWFSDETEKFQRALELKWGSKFSHYHKPNQIRKAFEDSFTNEKKCVLIPAKRKLETFSGSNTFNDGSSPEGKGILSQLFKAKNQEDGSEQRLQFSEIEKAFSSITGGYLFGIFIARGANQIELRFRRGEDAWLGANDCGTGFQDLLMILYTVIASEYLLILIEEPENHLHPEIQRRLALYLKDHVDKQFIIATHSSVFLNTQFADKVFTCRNVEQVKVENATSRAELLTEMGYSIADNLVSDVILLCEGPSDKPVIEEFINKLGLGGKRNIRIWPMGGDIMDQLDLTVFQQSGKVVALIDGDPKNSPVRKRFLEGCRVLNIEAFQLERYSIENYLSLRAIKDVLAERVTLQVGALDPNKRVSDQLGCDTKKNNGAISKRMKVEDIEGTDFANFLHKLVETPL